MSYKYSSIADLFVSHSPPQQDLVANIGRARAKSQYYLVRIGTDRDRGRSGLIRGADIVAPGKRVVDELPSAMTREPKLQKSM
jgi:hypothetical protein